MINIIKNLKRRFLISLNFYKKNLIKKTCMKRVRWGKRKLKGDSNENNDFNKSLFVLFQTETIL